MRDYVIDSDLICEWNWLKNNELGVFPDQITLGSGKSAWWICDNGHEYEMVLYRRKEGHNNCPYCLGKKVLVGFNDLKTVNPLLASEWNYEKNVDIDPTMLTGVCGKNVWWKCKNGHGWEAKISNRTNGNGCPYCCGYYILDGLNDLATTRPDLAMEWNYEKNGELLPTQISRGYGHKVWWTCNVCGYEWQAAPNSRDNMGSGCPACSKGCSVSSQEITLYYYVNKYFDDAIHGYSDKSIGITELDIYIPSLHVGIEYDGARWHEDVTRDKRKDVACYNNNIKLIRVREPKCPIYDSNCDFIYLENRSKKTLESACVNVLHSIGVKNIDVDFKRDALEIDQLVMQICRK